MKFNFKKFYKMTSFQQFCVAAAAVGVLIMLKTFVLALVCLDFRTAQSVATLIIFVVFILGIVFKDTKRRK